MPHLHLETTADLPENADIPDILEDLCTALIDDFQVDAAHTRAYHTLRSVWHVGPGAPPGFVHLTIAVLSGRDSTWKEAVSELLFNKLKRHFWRSIDATDSSVTVELREMDKNAYRRLE